MKRRNTEWRFPEQKAMILEEWKRRGLYLSSIVGVGGLIVLLVGLRVQELTWEALSFGEKLGIILYGLAVAGGVAVWAFANRKLRRLREKIAKGDTGTP